VKYATVCSGIEAPAVAWDPLEWEQVFASEIEKFPSAVMEHHKPNVPNLGDMTKYREWPDHAIDLICGGTPCQSFSIAGLRKGLDDPRGNLALTFIGLVDRYRPRWVLWENVPGVLSSGEGQDLESFIRGMAEIGYFGAWRVLDAQWFGVAQRRRRVFAIFCPRDWRPAAAVLLEPESLQGNPSPSREKGERIADSLTVGANQCSGRPEDFVEAEATVGSLCARTGLSRSAQDAQQGHLIDVPEVVGALSDGAHMGGGLNGQDAYSGRIIPCYANDGRLDFESETFVVPIHDKATRHGGKDGRGAGNGLGVGEPGDPMDTLTSGDKHAVFSMMPMNSGKDFKARETDIAQPVCAAGPGLGNQGGDAVLESTAVRRLTPVECERLQGFPDGYTAIPWRGKPAGKCPDGPRYKALGNSMAVPVIHWIGKRIQLMEEVMREQAA
jgi:DNA (cytosine-5)-methyltransferase 1